MSTPESVSVLAQEAKRELSEEIRIPEMGPTTCITNEEDSLNKSQSTIL